MSEPTQPRRRLAWIERAALLSCAALAGWFLWRVIVALLAVATVLTFVGTMLALSTPRRRSRH